MKYRRGSPEDVQGTTHTLERNGNTTDGDEATL